MPTPLPPAAPLPTPCRVIRILLPRALGTEIPRRLGRHVAVVFAPIRPPLLVGNPYAVLAIDGQARPGLEGVERADGNDGLRFAVVEPL